MGVQQSEVSDRHRDTGALKQVLLPPDGVPAGAAGLLLLLLLLSVERVEMLTGGPAPAAECREGGGNEAEPDGITGSGVLAESLGLVLAKGVDAAPHI